MTKTDFIPTILNRRVMGLKKHENLGVNELIHNQVLRTNIIRIVWKTVWRIANEISGVKGLRYENRDYSFSYWTGLPTASKTEIKMFLQQKVVLIFVHNDVTMKSKLKGNNLLTVPCPWLLYGIFLQLARDIPTQE